MSSPFIASVFTRRRRTSHAMTTLVRRQRQSPCRHRVPAACRRRPRCSAARSKPEAETTQRRDARRRGVSRSITRLRGRRQRWQRFRTSAAAICCPCRRCCLVPPLRPTRCSVSRCRWASLAPLSVQFRRLHRGRWWTACRSSRRRRHCRRPSTSARRGCVNWRSSAARRWLTTTSRRRRRRRRRRRLPRRSRPHPGLPSFTPVLTQCHAGTTTVQWRR